MRCAEFIRQAWNLTVASPKLKWFVFIPSFVAVIVFVAEIGWQVGLLSEELGFIREHFVWSTIGTSVGFLSKHHLLGWALFLGIFVLLFEFVLQSWILATLILSVRQKFIEPEKYLSLRQKMIEGSRHFFKLFEFHAIFSPFAFMTIVLFTGTMFRYYHGEIFSSIILPILLVYVVLAFLVNIFTSFCPYYMVCERCGVGESVRKSIGLVFLNFGTTMTIILVMFLVNFRIIINVLVVLGVPLGMIFLASYFATSSWLGLAMGVGVLIALVLLMFTAVLTAVVEVFSTAVWERAFTHLRVRQKSLAMDESKIAEPDFDSLESS
ncbi:hypothetical protein K9L63_02950 [Candidatus Gracilibacteria bacterium]|nr:hypothetical protein [Candidatus Gracilibacteria bacterium]